MTQRPARQKTILRLTIPAVLLLLALLLWQRPQPTNPGIGVAVAKGQLLSRHALPALVADEEQARDIALADDRFAAALAGKETDFLYAVPLARGEARDWQSDGCATYNCSQVTFYNYDDGGAMTAVVNLDQQRVVAQWAEPAARPAASLRLLPKLLNIAGDDPRVQAELGDIRAVAAVMVPMSTWLTDDACNEDWCIDLTFPSPHDDGRILHIVVNLHREAVARLFYTRARQDRSPLPGEPQATRSLSLKPVAQAGQPTLTPNPDDAAPFDNGCHEAEDWEVCWEMTAHDGLEFRDARYDGRLIFSSVKLSQVEAFYPAWPGGYRDEIGFDASVPPKFGTKIVELDDGFEVQQLFTEPFDWPNCVCCYRYEQILRFFADGAFELEFVSQGPGCDDLSTYRPFWRIDLALDGAGEDNVWYWGGEDWIEAAEETALPLFDELSPEGYKLATIDDGGAVSYRWAPAKTDPLGVDDGRLFAVQFHPDEGSGPILTGPADTYRPPRQWINGEPLSGENAVLWYVPSLVTKKGGPWWCKPDPEPEFNPCNALLRAEPAGELEQPSETAVQPTTESTATSEAVEETTPAAAAEATATPRPLRGETAVEIVQNAGCGGCHQIGSLGEAGKVGPDLSNIGAEAGTRVDGLTAAEYIRQSIMAPNAVIAPECPNGPCLSNVMPQNFAQRLSEEQIDTLVAFLLEQEEAESEPQVIPALPDATPSSTVGPTVENSPSVNTAVFFGVALLIVVLAGGLLLRQRRQAADGPADD